MSRTSREAEINARRLLEADWRSRHPTYRPSFLHHTSLPAYDDRLFVDAQVCGPLITDLHAAAADCDPWCYCLPLYVCDGDVRGKPKLHYSVEELCVQHDRLTWRAHFTQTFWLHHRWPQKMVDYCAGLRALGGD